MRIGFTGTQRGATSAQMAMLAYQFGLLEATEFHHGDCIGADGQAHLIARGLGLKVVLHPPLDGSKRAFCVADEVRAQLAYLDRNKAIVDETDCLIACPGEAHELLRSGTWSTVRYARKLGRRVIVIAPSGECL